MKSAQLFIRLSLFGAILSFSSSSFTALNQEIDPVKVLKKQHTTGEKSAEIFMKTEDGRSSKGSINATNGRVVWLYAGFLPRVYDYKRAKIVVSYKGLTARVSLKMTKEDIENYAGYLVDRFQEVEDIRLGQKNFPWVYSSKTKNKTNPHERYEIRRTPFEIVKFDDDPALDENLQYYQRQRHFIRTAVVPVAENRIAGKSLYRANLDLLKSLFPYKYSVIEDEGVESGKEGAYVHFHQVFPITGAAGGPNDTNAPKIKAGYGMYKSDGTKARRISFEEIEGYKAKYKNKNNIFAGMPFLQIDSDGAALHAPIRYMEAHTKAHSALTHGEQENIGNVSTERNWEELKKQTQVRWSLVREFSSGGCGRMEHVTALRNMLPVDSMVSSYGVVETSLLPAIENGYRTPQPSLQQIGISIQKDYDYFDFNNDGLIELVGVKYYRHGSYHSNGTNNNDQWNNMKSHWISKFYKNPSYKGASKPKIDGQECEYDTEINNPQSTCQLAEFPYTDPGLVQVAPKTTLTADGLSQNSNHTTGLYLKQALAVQLNRAPQERANKDQSRLRVNQLEPWED